MSGGLCLSGPALIDLTRCGPSAPMLESLFSLPLPGGGSLPHERVQRAASSGFFRSTSTLGNASTNQDSEDQWSDDGSCLGSASRRITMAKRVLAEATHTFTPCLSINAAKSDKCRNTGALGPLLCMIQSETEPEALRRCLDTLAFLLLDKANRKLVGELGGLNMLLALFTSPQHAQDLNLLRLALDCVCSLAKVDDAEKERVWAHPAKQGILALMSLRVGTHHLLEVMLLIRKLSFRGGPGAVELIEPDVLVAVANLLAQAGPTIAPAVLLKCCKLLKAAADCAGHEHVGEWHLVLRQLAGLLRDLPSAPEAVLDVLLSLSEHMAIKNMFMVVGGLPLLLPLLASPARAIAAKAASLVGSLSEGGLSRDQLCEEASLGLLLRTLAMLPAQHVDTATGIVYALTNLVTYSSQVASQLLAWDTPQRLQPIMQRWQDPELLLSAQPLLHALERAAAASQPVAATHPRTSAASGTSSALNLSVTDLQQAATTAGVTMPRRVPHASSSGSSTEMFAVSSMQQLQLTPSSSQVLNADLLAFVLPPPAAGGPCAHEQCDEGSSSAASHGYAMADDLGGLLPTELSALLPPNTSSQDSNDSASIACHYLLAASISNVSEGPRTSSPSPLSSPALAALCARQQSLPLQQQQQQQHRRTPLSSGQLPVGMQGIAVFNRRRDLSSDAATLVGSAAILAPHAMAVHMTPHVMGSHMSHMGSHMSDECDPMQPHDGPCSCKDPSHRNHQQQGLREAKPAVKGLAGSFL